MQLIHLEIYLAAVDAGSLAGAAKRLQYSPSRITERLQELEHELRAPLLDRTTRKLSLTAAGESLVPRARAILDELALIRTMFHNDFPQNIRVGIRSMPRDFRDAFIRLIKSAVGPNITVMPLDSATQVQMLRAGTLDLGVVWNIPAPPLRHHMILSEELGVAVPASKRFSALTSVRPSDLAGLKLATVVNPAEETSTNIGPYLEYLPHIDVVNGLVADAVYLLVSGGTHCSIVPLRSTEHATLAEETRRNILVLPLIDPAPRIGSYLVWRDIAEADDRLNGVVGLIRNKYPRPDVR